MIQDCLSGYPTKVNGSSTLLLADSAPNAEKVSIIFPERQPTSNMKIKLPEVEVTWFDGGLQPDKPAGWPDGKDMNNQDGGVIFHGIE